MLGSCGWRSRLSFAPWSRPWPTPRYGELGHNVGRGHTRGEMMNKIHNPAEIAPPVGAYSHAIEVPAGARMLHISGQVGITPDGKVAAGIEAQTEAALRNILGILKAAGMGLEDVVKLTTFLVNANDIAKVRAARIRVLGSHRPASTLVIISRLAAPEYLIEIEATAA